MTSVLSPPSLHQPGQQVPPNQELLSSLPHPDPQTHSEDKLSATADFEHVPRGTVSTSLNFYKPPEDGSKPHNWVEKPPEGQPQRNFGDNTQDIQIHDIRGKEDEYSLDQNAFAALKGYPHNEKINWDDDASIKEHYYPEVERILLDNAPGTPKRVLIFDHTIRRPSSNRGPVQRAHIDQTPRSIEMRVHYHLPEEEAKEAVKGRYRLINVWRPLNGPVVSTPLAFADSRTVPDSDMVGVEHRYPHRTGETAGIQYNPDHRWHYWSGMQNDERIMLQCGDSHHWSTRVPHSAFNDPRNDENSKGRQSIEVRALVFG